MILTLWDGRVTGAFLASDCLLSGEIIRVGAHAEDFLSSRQAAC